MEARWKYRAVRELRNTPELGSYHTYGLWVYERTGRGWELIRRVRDVSTSGDLVSGLAGRMEAHQLSPIHLMEVLEDSL